jgi:hypothetical protein
MRTRVFQELFYKHLSRRLYRNLKELCRNMHLDKNIWNAFIITFMTIPIILFLWNFEGDFKDKQNQGNILNLAMLTGTAGALLWTANGIHRQYHQNLLSKASRYIEEWYSDDLKNSIEAIRDLTDSPLEQICDGRISQSEGFEAESPILVIKNGLLKDGMIEGEPSRKLLDLYEAQVDIARKILDADGLEADVERIFSFFEQMGQDVKFGIVDSEYLKDFFYLIVIRYYESCRVYIEALQDRYSYCVYCNFVYLAQKWEKEDMPPRIPPRVLEYKNHNSMLGYYRKLARKFPNDTTLKKLLKMHDEVIDRC